ncbi:MAG: signal transduction [Planctomycetota bacterium]|nr:MAG: signal transduction [Planctomycetota bacterium]
MKDAISIRILENDNNRRGDLFGRLMADLFVAIGYENPRLNIHKSGRELDLSAHHRLESRSAVAECKATADTIGGDEVNKFVGALDAERKGKRHVTGYFISLGGFKETAIEQEKQGRRTKIVTLAAPEVVGELVKGHILIARDRATELAGRCCSRGLDLTLDPDAELLAHVRGWIWAVYYTQGKARSHFALIHADGTPLARVIAAEVIAADHSCGGQLHELDCLNPAAPPGADNDPRVIDALTAYGRYLAEECGFIQLDGLPADSDVGSRRLRLENLFIPLHLDVTNRKEAEDKREQKKNPKKRERQSVGEVLAKHPHLALLAAPGGGKSTLIKRLAVAYSDPKRRGQIADDLPQRDCLPLFFRCRELRGLTRGSFAQLLDALAQREPVRLHADVFRACVDRALLAGRVLLLVDGLDEISDPGDRAAFVCTLRTALQAYPGTSVVVTSREAGFRHVAAHLAPVCTYATLSPFDADDIRRLSVAWHREVVGDSEKVRSDAEQLAATIARNDRIQILAVNPLLLTTLLLVKRWVGSLPTRRAVLYGKAVEVLLMTWNTEGHDPIPDEEALPQLCYVASAMMIAGVQKISRPRLAALIQEARDSMPTELGYVKGTVEEFIHRVEDRSSLLMMTGHDVEGGRLVEFFEFRHLTFQEFLTARAMVDGWHPGRQQKDTLVSVLEPHLEEEKWLEVIPLAAVLGGKATEELIQQLTRRLSALNAKEPSGSRPSALASALGHCLADEAAARPKTIRAAMRELVRSANAFHPEDVISLIARGRYGADLRDEAGKEYLAAAADLLAIGSVLSATVWSQTVQSTDATEYLQAAVKLTTLLESPECLARCEGALGLLKLGFALRDKRSELDRADFVQFLEAWKAALVSMLFGNEPAEQFAAAWGVGVLSQVWNEPPPVEPDLLARLFTLWRTSSEVNTRLVASFALAYQPLGERDDLRRFATIPKNEWLSLLLNYEQIDDDSRDSIERYGKSAALIVAWYMREPWSDAEILERARALLKGGSFVVSADSPIRRLLAHLSEKT